MQRIVDIVEPIVGRGNVRAQVTADIDFTQSESTAEQYRPNQGSEPDAVRSQQVVESSDGAAASAQGVPGALSNQPPAAATATVNGTAQPTEAAPPRSGSAAAARREAVTNFEVDKTVRVTRNASGTIRRLSAAIVVNHRREVDEAGKVTLTPLAPADLENINALVREAMGFNKERGDSLNIVNAPFTEAEVPKEAPLELWQRPENIALARDIGKQLGLVLLGMIVIFALIRPVLKALARPPAPASKLAERVDDALQLPVPGVAATQAAQANMRQEDILKIARDNPAAVATVVRSWVATESKGA